MWLLINMILALFASYIIYNTALSFLGLYIPFKKTILPVLLFTVLIYASKILFNAPPVVHTIMLVTICTIIIYLFNSTSLLLNLCASLFTVIILTIGNLLIACTLMDKLGGSLTIINYNTLDWVILNIGELSIPIIVLIINRTNKFSFINQIITK